MHRLLGPLQCWWAEAKVNDFRQQSLYISLWGWTNVCMHTKIQQIMHTALKRTANCKYWRWVEEEQRLTSIQKKFEQCLSEVSLVRTQKRSPKKFTNVHCTCLNPTLSTEVQQGMQLKYSNISKFLGQYWIGPTLENCLKQVNYPWTHNQLT